MTPAPRISVLLPVHDGAATLAAALRSVRVQSFSDLECVVVDDGSTDATRLVLARAARDPRLRVLTTPHAGIVHALNTGLAACRGEFVARLDADDRMHPERLARQLRALELDPGLAGVGCHVRSFPRARLSAGRLSYERWLNSLSSEASVLRDRFVECPLAHPTLFLRREALDRRGGYRDVGWPEDYDLVLRMFAAGDRLGVVPEPLLAWRDSPNRLSRTHGSYALERFTACKAHFLGATWIRGSDYVLWGYGDTGRGLCKALAAHGRRPTHIVELHRGRIGQRVAGAPVIHPEALARLEPRPRRIVVSVAGEAARAEIRAALAQAKFLEERDYLCAA